MKLKFDKKYSAKWLIRNSVTQNAAIVKNSVQFKSTRVSILPFSITGIQLMFTFTHKLLFEICL